MNAILRKFNIAKHLEIEVVVPHNFFTLISEMDHDRLLIPFTKKGEPMWLAVKSPLEV
jgi:hypothetical protein